MMKTQTSMIGSIQNDKIRVALFHLDLGIGGAEQLMVNIARLLKESAYEVTIFTTHHDPNHCFEETKPDGVLGNSVLVYGDFLPRTVFGRFTAACSMLRMVYLAVIFLCFHYFSYHKSSGYHHNSYDILILDGVSTPIPLLRFFAKKLKILFYCHFPDLLLCTNRSNASKRLYRKLIDSFEEYSTSRAHCILVNSEFTAEVFKDTFPNIVKQMGMPNVLYPVVKVEKAIEVNRIKKMKYCLGRFIQRIIRYYSNALINSRMLDYARV